MNITKDSEINTLLQQLLLQIRSILAKNFIGMYIGGSLANESFHHETSDIDCYIITTSVLSKDIIKKIEMMHKEFYSRKLHYAKKVEASYIPQQNLINLDPDATRPYFNEGCFYQGKYGSNYIIELYILREKGITISGPNIKNLINEIPHQHLKLAIQKNLREYWEVVLKDTSKLKRSDDQVFAILTMCRTLYSLETGTIASKLKAAQWAMRELDNKWRKLIEQAITWTPRHEINRLEETQQLIRYTLIKSQDYAQ